MVYISSIGTAGARPLDQLLACVTFCLRQKLTGLAPDLVIPRLRHFPYYSFNIKCLQCVSRVGIALAVTTSIPTDGEIVYSQVSLTTFIFPLCYHKEVCLRGSFILYNLYFMLCVSPSLTTSDVLVSVSITGDSILIKVSTPSVYNI